MNATRERLYGAITMMNQKQLDDMWQYLHMQSVLNDAPEIDPDEEKEIMDAIDNDPDCHTFVPAAEAKKMLGLATWRREKQKTPPTP